MSLIMESLVSQVSGSLPTPLVSAHAKNTQNCKEFNFKLCIYIYVSLYWPNL